MAWTAPKTWDVGDLVTASDMNEQIRDNLSYVKEQADHWGEYIHIRDEKAQNTAGGTFTLGAWRTRDLNTIVADPASLATLGSNQITLPAGTYFVRASAPAVRVSSHQARLQNVTDGTTTMLGSSEVLGIGATNSDRSFIVGVFTIASSKTFEVQHQSSATQSTNGFGLQGNFATEVYTIVELWKVA